jgi:predicted acyltransferase
VLQRIAVCYLIASFIYLYTGSWRSRLGWTAALLAGSWALMKLVPVPGYGAGVLDPLGNLCWWVDSNLLAGHTWRGAPAPGFDPEGIVSTIPAIATTLFGVLTGEWLRSNHTPEEKTAWMFVAGNVLLVLGAIMDMWLPVNKNLWTSSYSVLMAGFALVCLATFYWVIDVKGYSRWAKPLVIYGMNAITAFVLAGVIGRTLGLIKLPGADGNPQSLQQWIFQTFYVPLASPLNASLLYAVSFMLLIYAISWIMWKRKWFLKV